VNRFRFVLIFAASLLPVTGSGASLVDRFHDLSCAVVRIDIDGGSGTGFFVNKTGRLLTAAHVVYDKQWGLKNSQIEFSVTPKQHPKMMRSDGTIMPIKIMQPDDAGKIVAEVDLAVVETGIDSSCYIPIGDSSGLKVGQHLISIGFPASNPTGVLYDGFLSAEHTHLPVPIGHVEGHAETAIIARYEVLRVQMPITPGASGAPVIDDNDQVVGIMSESPIIITNDIQSIIKTFGTTGLGSGITLSGFDTTKILAELAWVVSQFETPGSGYAVPVQYLKQN